jgi:hypothetical protein
LKLSSGLLGLVSDSKDSHAGVIEDTDVEEDAPDMSKAVKWKRSEVDWDWLG